MTPNSALLCLALNIYHEARGEPYSGQVAVAMVTMNRAQWKIENVCRVVYKEKQFSWTHQDVATVFQEPLAWKKANQIAKAILNGAHSDLTQGATHFHARGAQPSWRLSYKRTLRIGGHIFYTSVKKP